MEHSRRYVLDVRAAAQLVDRCRLDKARQVLAEHLPKPGQEDIRSFPWFNLWRICNDRPVTFQGHSDSNAKAIYHIEVSPRGDVLVSTGQDGTVRLWSTETGQLIRTLHGHAGDVNCAAYSPDSARLATGGDDGTIRVWSLAGDHEPMTLGKHTAWVFCLAFTADGRRLISGDRDGTMKVWDIPSRKLIRSFAAHGTIQSMELSPDGRALATCGADGKISLWDADSMQKIREFGVHLHSVQSVTFSHDGHLLAAGSLDGTVEIWDVARGIVLTTIRNPSLHSPDVQCVAFTPDAAIVASCGDDGILRLWDSRQGTLLQTMRAIEAPLWGVAFSRDGRKVFSCGTDGVIRRWDVAHSVDQRVVCLPSTDIQAIAFSTASDRLLLACRTEVKGAPRFAIGRLGPMPGGPLDWKQIEALAPVRASIFSSDSARLCTVDEKGQLCLWDVATAQLICSTPAITELANRMIYETSFIDSVVVIETTDERPGSKSATILWHVLGNKVTIRSGRFVPLVSLPETREMLVTDDSGLVRWDPRTDHGTRIAAVKNGNVNFRGMSLNQRIMAGFSNYDVGLFDARTFRREDGRYVHPARVTEVAFSPDFKVLASACEDNCVRIWDVATHDELLSFSNRPRPTYPRHCLQFSPDGTYLACAGSAGLVESSELIIWLAAQPNVSMP